MAATSAILRLRTDSCAQTCDFPTPQALIYTPLSFGQMLHLTSVLDSSRSGHLFRFHLRVKVCRPSPEFEVLGEDPGMHEAGPTERCSAEAE